MNYFLKIFCLFFCASLLANAGMAQKKNKKIANSKSVKATQGNSKKKSSNNTTQLSRESIGDTSALKIVNITSSFKPFLRDAAKVNFIAATPLIDSSKIPVTYSIPAQNLLFSYQPATIKPLAMLIDSGMVWQNNHYFKLGAGNFSSFLGEAAFSFGDGKKSITNVKGFFLTSTGQLPAQQANKWGVDVLTILNSGNHHEWTLHPFYDSRTQYLYGYEPASLNYSKDQLLHRFNTVGIETGIQNTVANAFGITYHPQLSYTHFSNNHGDIENKLILKAPFKKTFSQFISLGMGMTADISTANFPLIPNSINLVNNLYSINPALLFNTPNMKINAGILPSWDNNDFSLLPDLTGEMKIAETNLLLEAGWKGYFQKNTYQSLSNFNPWIGSLSALYNTKINEIYAGMKGASGNHVSYQGRFSYIQYHNQALFVNNNGDGKTFNVLFEPEMQAFRVKGEIGYNVQERLSFLASATYSNYSSLAVNKEPWGLLPLEITGTVTWKLLKDLQVKSDLFFWDGNQYPDKLMQTRKADPALDVNVGLEFGVMPKLNVWLQMNNLINNTYQRWNQYTVLGFNILGGVVYSFR